MPNFTTPNSYYEETNSQSSLMRYIDQPGYRPRKKRRRTREVGWTDAARAAALAARRLKAKARKTRLGGLAMVVMRHPVTRANRLQKLLTRKVTTALTPRERKRHQMRLQRVHRFRTQT